MSGPRIGGLFAGYGGLEMGVQSVLGGELAWYSEIDKGALKILTHHHPDVPNVGDITTVDWSQVEPVDILTGGSPCQDLSHAGKRAGMTDGTRSNLWVAMREAIAQLRPALVVWENVRGAYSASADSDMEHCPGCMGDPRHGGFVLRALGRVLGDLSDLGYDAGWHGLRAADVGAPHGRMRVFVVAYPRDGAEHGERSRPESRQGSTTVAIPTNLGHEWAGGARDRRFGSPHGGLLPTPAARDWKGAGPADAKRHDPNLSAVTYLLPTPAVNDMGATYTPDEWDAWTDRMKTAHGNGNGHGKPLSIEAQRLLPTPSVADSEGGHERRGGARGDELLLNGVAKELTKLLPTPMVGSSSPAAHGQISGQWRDQMAEAFTRWGAYADAITRWGHTIGRPAPAPTMTSTKGNPQLAPAFVEWMMGLPAGWVTDTPGITRNEALKALGNGVVPQQAEAALRFLLGAMAVAA